MTDLKPLRESSRDDFARDVLKSAFLDEPPRHALRRTALWLGVGEAAAATLATGSALGASSGLAAPLSTHAASTGSAAVIAALKWLGAGALLGAVTAGGIEYTTRAPTPPTPARAVAAPAAPALAPRPVPRAIAPPIPALREPVSSSAQPAREPRPRASSAAGASREATEARVPRAPALEAEIGQLDRARAALARGKPEGALAELDAYERRRKTLVLDREATVLRIDALLGQGERAAAARLARAYVAAHPDDPHARRLRALAEPGKGP